MKQTSNIQHRTSKVELLRKPVTVFLVNDCEYVAAASSAEAKEFAATSEYDHEQPVEVREANHHGFCDDGYADHTPDRTMIQEARRQMIEGKETPFHLAVHFDLL